MVRLFHTADLHLGLKFTRGGYSPDLRKALVDQRLRTLESLVATANERQCAVFVIAGDLFDTPRVTQGLVRQGQSSSVYGTVSPMVFLGRRFWTEELPAEPLLRTLAGGRRYAELIGVADTADEALDVLRRSPPLAIDG